MARLFRGENVFEQLKEVCQKHNKRLELGKFKF